MNKEELVKYFERLKAVGLLPNSSEFRKILETEGLKEFLNEY